MVDRASGRPRWRWQSSQPRSRRAFLLSLRLEADVLVDLGQRERAPDFGLRDHGCGALVDLADEARLTSAVDDRGGGFLLEQDLNPQ